MKARVLSVFFLVLMSCADDAVKQVETLEVKKGAFTISQISKGELRAAVSTPITPPRGSRNPRTVQWMPPNYSAVKKGDVVARFDVSDAERGARTFGIEVDKVDLQVIGKERELDRLLAELGNELELVDIEKIMAEVFSIDNELAYSRQEIIDATRDKELLDYKSGHLEGKKGNYSDRQGAEVGVLNAQRATQESQLREQQQMLDNNQVLAPHDGFLVYEKTWWGEQIEIGSTVFPGNKIASIPNLERMEAVLHVLETEAMGLAEGQPADLVIDAFPDRPLTGSITSVSATAAPIERDSPVKYFTVVVGLDASDPDWITPDAAVTATIHINQLSDAIAIPNQSIFNGDEGDWVLVRDGRKLTRQPVKLGLRGANRSQIVQGLEGGEEIALFPPEDFES